MIGWILLAVMTISDASSDVLLSHGTKEAALVEVEGGFASLSLSQFNTGAQDVATPAVSAPTTTDVTTTAPLTTGSQILGGNGLVLPNATTSGAVPQALTSAAVPGPLTAVVEQGEVIAASGSSSITGGAQGPCPSAWRLGTKLCTSPRPVGRGYAPAR